MLAALLVGLSVGGPERVYSRALWGADFYHHLGVDDGLDRISAAHHRGISADALSRVYNFLGGGYLLGVPFPALIFALVFLTTHFLMGYTTLGRSIYAVGAMPRPRD